MKKYILILAAVLLCLCGCSSHTENAQVAVTTLPVYSFTTRLCEGTGITVSRLVTESVSCLHDYTLQTRQMRVVEGAEVIVISGAGLEEFLDDALEGKNNIIDASHGLSLLEGSHEHDHDHGHDHGHVHAEDPHIWLSPINAKLMAENICRGLSEAFPEHQDILKSNLSGLLAELDALQAYGEETLKDLSCRELITFHDGFSYLAESFDLHILRAVEEESGSEAAASELIELISIVRQHDLPAVFTETNGSDAAAKIICSETGVKSFMLDMAMAGGDYFDAMYHNINSLREALQ